MSIVKYLVHVLFHAQCAICLRLEIFASQNSASRVVEDNCGIEVKDNAIDGIENSFIPIQKRRDAVYIFLMCALRNENIAKNSVRSLVSQLSVIDIFRNIVEFLFPIMPNTWLLESELFDGLFEPTAHCKLPFRCSFFFKLQHPNLPIPSFDHRVKDPICHNKSKTVIF